MTDSIRTGDAPPTPWWAIASLALAAFASIAALRICDQLLPHIAAEFGTTTGGASAVATAYAIAYGACQLLVGPIGDRMGKYRLIVILSGLSILTSLLAPFATTLAQLSAARFLAGAVAGGLVPLSLAWIGDTVPYEQRQGVIARFLTGTAAGFMAGQGLGGIIGDLYSWRAVFGLVAGLFALSLAGLLLALVKEEAARRQPVASRLGLFQSMAATLAIFRNPAAVPVLAAVAVEGFFYYGGMTFVGADLQQRFGVPTSLGGPFVGLAGIGTLLYAAVASKLVRRLGERQMIIVGGVGSALILAMLALSPDWHLAPPLLLASGFLFLMIHNTLQVRATQMVPTARGAALATFAFALFIGQTIGIALGAIIFDRVGGPALLLIAAMGILAVTAAIARR